jgi:hypothetical protein
MNGSKPFPVIYECLFCGHPSEKIFEKEIQWRACRGDATTRGRCPECGKFMVPRELKHNQNVPRQLLFEMFSACPNAHHCELFDQYDADCEEGRVLPKCIHVLHQRLEIAMHLLDELKDKQGSR